MLSFFPIFSNLRRLGDRIGDEIILFVVSVCTVKGFAELGSGVVCNVEKSDELGWFGELSVL